MVIIKGCPNTNWVMFQYRTMILENHLNVTLETIMFLNHVVE